MKPQILFEFSNLGKPLAWLRTIKFLSIVQKPYAKVFRTEKETNCLVWKPELFEPKYLKKKGDAI